MQPAKLRLKTFTNHSKTYHPPIKVMTLWKLTNARYFEKVWLECIKIFAKFQIDLTTGVAMAAVWERTDLHMLGKLWDFPLEPPKWRYVWKVHTVHVREPQQRQEHFFVHWRTDYYRELCFGIYWNCFRTFLKDRALASSPDALFASFRFRQYTIYNVWLF